MRSTLIVMTLTCLLLAAPAWSWNEEGHRAVAMMAERSLSAEAKLYVESILQAHPYEDVQNLADSACWPDRVRSDPTYHHGDWHYTSPPVFIDLPVRTITDIGQSLRALNLCTAILKDPKASPLDKAVALSWVVHLLGDIHQPLHAASRYSSDFPEGDRGGNLFLVLLDQEPTNLHTFWDSAGGLFWQGANRERLDAVVDELWATVIPSSLDTQERSPLVWQEESHILARDVAYDGVELDQPLSADYTQRALEISQQRMTLAGYRLAAYLERLAQAAPVTAINDDLL